jgi:TonB dependent receptor-like, beta-barrel/Carboxypeptidase regulatory-like domain
MQSNTFASANRKIHRYTLVVLAATCFLLPRIADAQGLTGTLVGTVKDEQGAVLPGAAVRAASPSLIGGPATMITNERGQLRFPVLLPGTYVLDIELAGFVPYHETDIHIGAGATLDRTIVLKVAGVAESIVVEGTGSRIDARSSGFETRFGPEYLRTIPTRRFSMFDAIKSAPGVSPTSPSSGTVNTVAAFGSGGNENLFLIDGTNFTCPCAGVSRAEPSVDIIQEVQVQSVGVSAEYGNIQGTVFNVITRQGSNRFLYDASFYGQAARLTAQPVLLSIPRTNSQSGYTRERYRDFTTNLGGPLRHDRLWFFGGYQYLRDYDSQPGTDPQYPRTYEQNKIFAKLTWQLKPGLQLMQSFNDEFWVSPQTPTLVTPFEATARVHATVPTVTFGHLTHTLSPNTFWDVRVGRFVYLRDDDPSTGDPTVPSRFDRVTGVTSGNPPLIGHLTLIRTTAKATLSHYQRGLFAADHEWKIGTQVEKGEHQQAQVIPGGISFVDNNSEPFQAISAAPSNSGGQFITIAAFASDALILGDRLTVNAGVRFDHSRAISQDLPAVDVFARETGETIRGLGTLYTWNVVSPRLGVTAKLTADGRTILRGSYGRFNQGVLTGELSPIHPGVSSLTTTEFDPSTGGYTRLVSVVDPNVNLLLDPHTRTPRTDEYSIGIDRELPARLAVAAAYIRKTGGNFIAWTDVAGQYRDETRTLPDGRTLPVYVLAGPTASRRFLLTNPEGYSLTYDGLVMVAEKRRSDRWQALASYTLSRTRGLQVSSGASAADPQVSTVAPAFPTTTFGRDPNNLTNAYGRLPNDRPHMFRVMGTFDLAGFAVGTNLQYFSGKPWAATAQVKLDQGDQRILLEPRGSRRLSSQSLLDLRVSKRLSVRRMGQIELLVDVLNVLNDTAEENLATDNLYSPNFAQPTIFIDPRRAMLGVRLNLGR